MRSDHNVSTGMAAQTLNQTPQITPPDRGRNLFKTAHHTSPHQPKLIVAEQDAVARSDKRKRDGITVLVAQTSSQKERLLA